MCIRDRYKAFKRVLENRRGAKPLDVDGYKNFLFLNQNGLPHVAISYDAIFRRLVETVSYTHLNAYALYYGRLIWSSDRYTLR